MFERIPLYTVGGLVTLSLGLICQIFGIATTHWHQEDQRHYGLFQWCTYEGCQPITSPSNSLRAVQAFQIIAGLLALTGMALAFWHGINWMLKTNYSRYCFLACSTSLVAIILGEIIYYIDVTGWQAKNLGFSYYLCLLASFFIGTSGDIILFCSIRAPSPWLDDEF